MKKRRPAVPTFVEFCTSPRWLGFPFSPAQRVLAKAVYGEPLSAAEIRIWRGATGRDTYGPPPDGFRTVSIRCGASSGKTHWIAAPLAIYEALFRSHRTEPGEQQPVIAVMAQDRDASRGVVFSAIRSLVERVPFLREQLAKPPGVGEILFANGMLVKMFARTSDALHGYALKAFVGDEYAHWAADPLENSAEEIAAVVNRATSRAMSSKPRAVWITTPKAAAGLCWQHHQQLWGKASKTGLHFWAPTLVMNPTADQEAIDELRRSDPARAKRFYDAEFSSTSENYLDESWIRVTPQEPGPMPVDLSWPHSIGFDMSGGRTDEAAMSVVRHEAWVGEDGAVEDLFRQVELLVWSPTPGKLWDPLVIYRRVIERCRAYRVALVAGDLFGGEENMPAIFRTLVPGYPVVYEKPSFQKFHPSTSSVSASGHATWSQAKYERQGRNKSQVLDRILPLWSAGRIILLDRPPLLYQARTEERITTGVEVKYDHPRGGHDDQLVSLANAVYTAASGHVVSRRAGDGEAAQARIGPVPVARAAANRYVPSDSDLYAMSAGPSAGWARMRGGREQRREAEEVLAERLRRQQENAAARRRGEEIPFPADEPAPNPNAHLGGIFGTATPRRFLGRAVGSGGRRFPWRDG